MPQGVDDAIASNRPGAGPRPRAVGAPVADPASETVRLYAAEWARFVAWCRETRRAALPASGAIVAAHLVAAAPGLSRGALGRRRAAIGAMHRQRNLPVPQLDAATRAELRAAARPISRARRDPFPAAASLIRMAAGCPRDLAGLRDRSLLLLVALTGRCGPGGRPETGRPDREAIGLVEPVARTGLLELDAEHVRFTAAGVTLLLRARDDAAQPSRAVSLTRGATAAACPVRALEDWLTASDTAFGPVFRKVDRWGNVEHARLAPDAWGRVIARRSGSPRRRRSTAKLNP